MSHSYYTLRNSHKILETSYDWYKKKWESLDPAQLSYFESQLAACDAAFLAGDRAKADASARLLEVFNKAHFKKSFNSLFNEIFIALFFALSIAIVVRQMWFEPMEIPTGSMRPTFKEQDHLTVSKTQFGLNIPLRTDHFYFDPSLVQRGGIVIWSGDNIALSETHGSYFDLIPYVKRYVKRMIGKPGDTLYFYGGKVYGIDKEGEPIQELLNDPSLQKLEHIPFLTFEGDIRTPKRGDIQFDQMHQPIGRLRLNTKGEWQSEIYDSNTWVKDNAAAQLAPHERIESYADYMGIRNFAMARLLTKKQLNGLQDLDASNLEDGVLYLELAHHPSLSYPKPILRHDNSSLSIALQPLKSVIPLQEKHLKAIRDNLYTARFEVKDGFARRYSTHETPYNLSNPRFPNIPNGTYEFYYGKAYSVGWGGKTTELSESHPLYSLDPTQIQSLYNFGIDMSSFYEPRPTNTSLFPHRYAYFRNGDLYLMGAPILTKEDSTLQNFLSREDRRQNESAVNKPYTAFKDYGPPIKDGVFDKEFIRQFGIEVPPKHYLVLGDNHAMSADSRIFGFLPQQNLQGVPDLILWPPGQMGRPVQPAYQLFTFSRLSVWCSAAIICLLFYLYHRNRMKKPVFKKLSPS